MPTALITGITGQDGQYMAEFLHEKGYKIYGLLHGQANPKAKIIRDTLPFVELVSGDLQDLSSLITTIESTEPDEVYNYGAISFVAFSFQQPEVTANVTGLGVLRLLEAIRIAGGTGSNNRVKFYQASSSEMFGKVDSSPQNEEALFHPRSPYGVSKVFGHHVTVNYREAYGLFACSGICFNHESPRRGLEFVTRKVTHGLARIKHGLDTVIELGNMDAARDWGFAGDYIEAMWLMLQQPEPEDFVVATGVTHTVGQMIELAFEIAGIDDWARYVRVDPKHLRPADVEHLVGDATKAQTVLGWKPRVSFEELIRMMVEADLELVGREVAQAPR